ncbi:hypothetical protein [Shouchella patagoniensis]|uniref:hypothetical protein n=1 Tax=Shouchella patagoniensis TaxID=228576 RepID=UPI000994B7F4|nr:hypothetical protein [Shouchella patagoniensis]
MANDKLIFKRDDHAFLPYAKKKGFVKPDAASEVDWSSVKISAFIENGKLIDHYGEIVPGIDVELEDQEDGFDVLFCKA